LTGLDAEGTDPSESLILSVCTTSYNIAHAIERHFSSVCNALAGISFEYVVVDNRSSDGTAEILSRLAHSFPGFKVIARRCSRGIGRRLAASASKAPTILCVDADTVYRPSLGAFVRLYLKEFRSRDIALQAIYAGLYPRSLWFQVGGTRDLNYAEDLDLWMRIWELGRMKWTPVLMGENLKPSGVRDSEDVFYKRYSMLSRVSRVLRRETDMWRLRRYYKMDLEAIWRSSAVDLGIGMLQETWFGNRPSWSLRGTAQRIRRDFREILS